MSTTTSEPILALFRKLLADKGLNTATLARLAGEKRSVVRQVLAGKTALTVDQMVRFAEALEVDMTQLAGLPETVPAEPIDLRPESGPVTVDPYGLQAEQALKLAFGLGVNFAFVCDTTQLAGCGVPERVLEAHPRKLVIQLDAAFHAHNAPRYEDDGVHLTLSFDGLCHCAFPWSAIVSVSFQIEPPSPEGKRKEPKASGPKLRLVT